MAETKKLMMVECCCNNGSGDEYNRRWRWSVNMMGAVVKKKGGDSVVLL